MPGANIFDRLKGHDRYYVVDKKVVEANITFHEGEPKSGYTKLGQAVFLLFIQKFDFEAGSLTFRKSYKDVSTEKYYIAIKCEEHQQNFTLQAPIELMKPDANLKLTIFKDITCACDSKLQLADTSAMADSRVFSDASIADASIADASIADASNADASNADASNADATNGAINPNSNGSNAIPPNTQNNENASLNGLRDEALNEDNNNENPLISVSQNEPLDRTRNRGLNASGNNFRTLRSNNGGNKRVNESDDWSVVGPQKVRVLEQEMKNVIADVQELKRVNGLGLSPIAGGNDQSIARESYENFIPPPRRDVIVSTPHVPIQPVAPTSGGIYGRVTASGTQVNASIGEQLEPTLPNQNELIRSLQEEMQLIRDDNAKKEEEMKMLRKELDVIKADQTKFHLGVDSVITKAIETTKEAQILKNVFSHDEDGQQN